MSVSKDPERRRRQLANLRPAPAAPVGNRRALRHGGYATVARERLDAKTRQVFEALAFDAPLRDADGGLPAPDAAIVMLLAQCLVRVEDVAANVAVYGVVDERTDTVRGAAELERRLRLEAAGYMNDMGMTPASRARLGLDLARSMDLAGLMADDYRREQEAGR